MSALGATLLSIVSFLVVLGLLILVHELGHYFAGRLQGFSIESFSIGFGPILWEHRGKYNLLQVRWLLLGGYVKFAEEFGPEEAEKEDGDQGRGPGAVFMAKARWRRFLVMIMGAAFNALLAFGLFAGLAMVGWQESVLKDSKPVVGWVAPDLPAANAGIRPGDLLLRIDGRPVKNWDEAREAIALNQQSFLLAAERGGKTFSVTITPVVTTFLHQPVGDIGVYPALPPIIGGVYKPSPAHEAGLRPGDRIVSVDGETFQYWDQFQRAMARGGHKARRFVIERGDEPISLTIAPRWNDEAKRYLVGIAPRESTWVRYPFPSNLAKAWRVSVEQSSLAFRTIEHLVTRKIGLGALSGPVSIAYITGQVARTGPYNLLMLLAVISLQLAIFNVLPIPGLDGGQILVLCIEGAFRRDLPVKVKERILLVGFSLLILLFAVIMVLDVAKFFS